MRYTMTLDLIPGGMGDASGGSLQGKTLLWAPPQAGECLSEVAVVMCFQNGRIEI